MTRQMRHDAHAAQDAEGQESIGDERHLKSKGVSPLFLLAFGWSLKRKQCLLHSLNSLQDSPLPCTIAWLHQFNTLCDPMTHV